MLEASVPFSVVATVMGWSPLTTVRMAKRHDHIGEAAVGEAVKALDRADFEAVRAQNWAQPGTAQEGTRPN